MPQDHPFCGAKGGHRPCGEQPHIIKYAGPFEQRETGMTRQLCCTGDTSAHREGKCPIGQGKSHMSSAGPESQKNCKTGPENHKPKDRYAIEHSKQLKAMGNFSRDRALCNVAENTGSGHGLPQGTQNDPQGWNAGGARGSVMRQPAPDH